MKSYKKEFWARGHTMKMAEQAMAAGATVMDDTGRKGKIIKIDYMNRTFTFLIRFGNYSLAWIGYDKIRLDVPEEADDACKNDWR